MTHPSIKIPLLALMVLLVSCGRNLPDLEPGNNIDKLITVDQSANLSGVPLFDLRFRQRFNFDHIKGKDSTYTTVQVFNLSANKIDSCIFLFSPYSDSIKITKNLLYDYVYTIRDLGILQNTNEDTINIILPNEFETNKIEVNILKIYGGSTFSNYASSGYYTGDYEALTDLNEIKGQQNTRVVINADGSLSALFDNDFDIQRIKGLVNNNNYIYGEALNKDLQSLNNVFSDSINGFSQVNDSLYIRLDCSLLNKDFKFLYFLLTK